jgi:hypothetical protein
MQSQVDKRRRLSWALIRLTLGCLQMMGAVASLLLFVETGVNTISLASVIVTGLFTTLGVLLFGSRLPRWSSRQSEQKGEYGQS